MRTGAPPVTTEERDLQRALRLVRFLREPALPGFVLMAVLILGGFAAIVFGYSSAARTLYVPLQIPGAVSGGLGGLALIGVGATLWSVHADRRDAAKERRITDDVLDEMADLIASAPRLREIRSKRVARRGGV